MRLSVREAARKDTRVLLKEQQVSKSDIFWPFSSNYSSEVRDK